MRDFPCFQRLQVHFSALIYPPARRSAHIEPLDVKQGYGNGAASGQAKTAAQI